MIAGRLQEKNGKWYMVLSYPDPVTGKRKQPWFATGLDVKGNKKKAEEMLSKLRRDYVIPNAGDAGTVPPGDQIDFADFMLQWLEFTKHTVSQTTYASYQNSVTKKIVPYFRKHPVTLKALEPRHIQNFYLHELKTVKANTVKHEHANIHKALEHAIKMDLIPYNVSDRVELPKVDKYVPEYFRESEILTFLEKTKDHKLSLLFQIAIFYGMRKEEIVGLTWDEIDFENDCFTIGNTVKQVTIDGKRQLVMEKKTKNQSSYRTMPLLPAFKEKLLLLKKKQQENKRICGNCYDYTYDGYVFVDPMGALYEPDYVYRAFKRVLKQNDLRDIRFHDLRHSCASLMVTKGDGINNVQKWLGHSDISTTANIYAHLDFQSKVESAEKMGHLLPIPTEFQTTDWEESQSKT